MRGIVIITLVALMTASFAWAEDPDSVRIRQLQEVVVDAENQYVTANSAVYIPTPKQKEVAQDGLSLLNQMAIPQLNINPLTNTVLTNSGNPVAIFIDYVPASSQDIQGMLTKDVKKIEYLTYPQDPRFRNAQYVINFIMRKYEWGGYTKLNAEQSLAVYNTKALLFSKFVYKNMIFDFYADEKYDVNNKFGTESIERFKFDDLNGEGEKSIGRISTTKDSKRQINTNNVAFRAIYLSGKTNINNLITFNYFNIPRNDVRGQISFEGGTFPESTSFSKSKNEQFNLNYGFEIHSSFNSNCSINILASYDYSHNRSNNNYISNSLDIINDACASTHHCLLTPAFHWNPDSHNSFAVFMNADYTRNSIDYFGSSPSDQTYDIIGAMVGIRYIHNRKKWNAGTMTSWVYAYTDFSGVKNIDNFPQGTVFATYVPNRQNQIQIEWKFEKTIPETYMKSPTMLRQDALIWFTGKPDLKNFWDHRVKINYLWLPNNKWQLSANFSYFNSSNRVISKYTPDGPDGTMLRRYVNNGVTETYTTGINATGKFIRGKLIINLQPQFRHSRSTGFYNRSHNEAMCSAQMSWYFGNFYLLGWYLTPSSYFESRNGMIIRRKSSYMLQCGWGRNAWRVTLSSFNFMRTSWNTTQRKLNSPYYDTETHDFGTDGHMQFKLSVSYVFNYGKKVTQDDELTPHDMPNSTILR